MQQQRTHQFSPRLTVLMLHRWIAAAMLPALLMSMPVRADIEVLRSFSGPPDGSTPQTGVIKANDGNLYGTTNTGGASSNCSFFGCGTVFRVDKDGNYTSLASFENTNGSGPTGLVEGSDGDLYGTTFTGGDNQVGTIFRVSKKGRIKTLVSLNSYDAVGSGPRAGLVEGSDGNFYGTTTYGGVGGTGCGSVFQVTPQGVATALAAFTCSGNNEGSTAPLIQASDGNFYGTINGSGDGSCDEGCGFVFRVTPAGQLTYLVTFDDSNGADPGSAGLLQASDGNFYGVTNGTGTGSSNGNLFSLTLDGIFTNLVNFDYSHGAGPATTPIQGRGGAIYGATASGGDNFVGTLYRLGNNGKLKVLASFNYSNGEGPQGAIVREKGGRIFGTTNSGGDNDLGVIYRFDPGPE